MSEFGVKDYHESSIVNFMRFSRAQRNLSLRTIQAAYKEIEHDRLKDETTMTVEEVHEMLADLWDSAKEEIDTELSHQSHTYVLLLRQLFMQAENWHLKLQADISELENKELLDKVKAYENEHIAGKKSYQAPRLEPVNDSGATVLLKQKISSLENENDHLRDKLEHMERKLHEFADQRNSRASNEQSNKSSRYTDDEVNELERKMDELQNEMHKSKEYSSKSEKAIENEMVSVKHRYLEIQEQLSMAEKELERKFNKTNAYKNMKQMLDKKNDQIKDLRRRLNRYEPPDE